jgi:amino acid adenylation domain-containing protein
MGAGHAVSTPALIETLRRRGITLWFEGERLRFRAPKGALTAADRAELSARRDEVCRHLRATAAASVRIAPLSFSQQALWLLHQQAPDSAAYHVAIPLAVCGEIDVPALRQAMQAVVDRHATLRTTYGLVDGVLSQRIADAGAPAFETRSSPGLSDDALRVMVEDEFRQPFDLARGPVCRALLISRAPQDHVLIVTFHHIAVDAWSLLLLIQEIGDLYAEATGRGTASLPLPDADYADYVRWQEIQLAGPDMQRLWSYWQRKLAPPRGRVDLPTDRLRSATQTFHGSAVSFRTSHALVERVRTLARREATTPFVVLLAIFKATLFRLTASEDIVVGTPTLARGRSEFLHTVGDFVNSLPLRSRLDGAMIFRDLIAQVRQTVHEAIEAQDFPFPLLVQRLQPEREPGRSPLFDTFFLFQRFEQFKQIDVLLSGGADEPVELGGLRLRSYPIEQQAGQFDLALQMVERADGFAGAFTYRTDLFDEATVGRFAQAYLAVADAMTANPTATLGTAADLSRQPGPVDDGLAALLDQFRMRDIRLSLDGDRLRVNAPKGAIDDAIKGVIGDRRDAIIAALKSASVAVSGRDTGDLPVISRVAPLPVSAAQCRLWFLDRMEPGRALYNIGFIVRIGGPVDIDRLRGAILALIARHESLRISLGERDGGPWLEIGEPSEAAIRVASLGPTAPELKSAAIRERAEAWLRRPFDLAAGPLARFLVQTISPDECVLVASMHHAIADGWSLAIARREIFALYGSGPAESTLPPLAVHYVDYAAWECAQMRDGRLAAQLDYWLGQLRDAPAVLALPTDRPRPAAPSHRGARVMRYFDVTTVEHLKTCCREQGVTPFMPLLAAWMVLMYRYSGQDDIVIGSPTANRASPALEGVIGCLINTMALRGRLDGNPTFAAFLAQMKRTTLAAMDNADVPFDAVVEKLNPDRNAGSAPIFQVLFTFMSFSTHVASPPGLTLEAVPYDTHASRFDLTVELGIGDIGPHAGEYCVMYEYATDLFDAETIERMHTHFETILAAAAANPQTPIDDLKLPLPSADGIILARLNETAAVHDRRRGVHHLLEASAHAAPYATAVIGADATLTYQALDRKANRLAHLLGRRGISRGDRVAVCLGRTSDMPVVLAAVLKSGAAYVPLDPSHPAERLGHVVADADVACVVTITQFAPLFDAADTPVILLDTAADALAQEAETAPGIIVQPEDLAYVIYTSGSTGKPKGVQVEHRNVVSFLAAMRLTPGITDTDTLLAVTTISFDIAGLEMWLPLSVGGRIVIASRSDVLDGASLTRLIDAHDVTMLQATPATWRLLLDAGWRGKSDLKALCGGEAMPRDLAAALLGRVSELWNMYGPTETTIWSTAGRVVEAAGAIPIGQPIANTRVYVLDAACRPVPIGVVGELCIGGEGVARGYWMRPELTAERFVTIALPDGTPERVYRTGDAARICRDGRIAFLGRLDRQVKIRGHRIELGEVEAALVAQPCVKACVVTVRADKPGDPTLVGYVVLNDAAVFDPDAARTALRRMLPDYMVPSRFVVLLSLPLTPNGKIDHKALPANAPQAEATATHPVPLMSPVERRVAAIWNGILQLDRVGLYDNFFDLGGHSLLLVKLHAELTAAFDSDLALVELFQHTTVAAQANRLGQAPASGITGHRDGTLAEKHLYV